MHLLFRIFKSYFKYFMARIKKQVINKKFSITKYQGLQYFHKVCIRKTPKQDTPDC